MLMIVGLGNPSKTYENTFHNLGFMAVDALAARLGVKIKKSECFSLTAALSKNGERIVLAKPLTYMNLSGQAVKGLLAKYKTEPHELIVLYDDFDIPRFTLRARQEGGPGTHNGMRSIVDLLNTQGFKRIRIGMGQGGEAEEKRDYVLSSLSAKDKDAYAAVFARLAEALEAYLKNKDFDALMRTVNTAPLREEG